MFCRACARHYATWRAATSKTSAAVAARASDSLARRTTVAANKVALELQKPTPGRAAGASTAAQTTAGITPAGSPLPVTSKPDALPTREGVRWLSRALESGDVDLALGLLHAQKRIEDSHNWTAQSHYYTWSPVHRLLIAAFDHIHSTAHLARQDSSKTPLPTTAVQSMVQLLYAEPALLAYIPGKVLRSFLKLAGDAAPEAGHALAKLLLAQSHAVRLPPPFPQPWIGRDRSARVADAGASEQKVLGNDVQTYPPLSYQRQSRKRSSPFDNVRSRLFLTTALLNGILATILAVDDTDLLRHVMRYIRRLIKVVNKAAEACTQFLLRQRWQRGVSPFLRCSNNIRTLQSVLELDPDTVTLNHFLADAVARRDLEVVEAVLQLFDVKVLAGDRSAAPTTLAERRGKWALEWTAITEPDVHGRDTFRLAHKTVTCAHRIPNQVTYTLLMKLYLSLDHPDRAMAVLASAAAAKQLSPQVVGMTFYLLNEYAYQDATILQAWSLIKPDLERCLDVRSLTNIVDLCCARLGGPLSYNTANFEFASALDSSPIARIAVEALTVFHSLAAKNEHYNPAGTIEAQMALSRMKRKLWREQSASTEEQQRKALATRALEDMRVVNQCSQMLQRLGLTLSLPILPRRASASGP
ncbi:hypothetical protein RI367_004604 [Sorochytrium milnesiophthora]